MAMSLEKWALMIAMLSGVPLHQAVNPDLEQAWHNAFQHQSSKYVNSTFEGNQDMSEDDIVDTLLDKLYSRVLAESDAQHEGLDSTMLGKPGSLALPTSGQQAMMSSRLPGVSTQPRFAMQPAAMPGRLSGTVPGKKTEQFCFPAVVQNAAVKAKKGTKIVDGREVPFNIFSKKEPLIAKVIKNDKYPQTITENTGDPNWETVHVTFDHGGKFPYLEGMSLGIISPGPDKKGQTPANIRLYSIASSAVGDDQTSKTVSLCVKRVVEVDGKFTNREVGEDKKDKAGTGYPENKVYRGVCSNYLCDLSIGDEVTITGPVGTEMLLPEDPDAVYIMLATGTGIAPMRSYLRLLFNDKAGQNKDGSNKFKGLAWLFMGVPYSKSLLYDDENKEYLKKFPDQFRYEYAISREDKNAAGQKMYIQTKIAEYAEEVWDLLQYSKTHVYMCGLKGMESGMKEALEPIAKKNGFDDWDALVKTWKKAGRWHVEVY